MIQIPENITELKSYKPGKPLSQVIEELGLTEVAVLWNNENNFGPSPKAMEFVLRRSLILTFILIQYVQSCGIYWRLNGIESLSK